MKLDYDLSDNDEYTDIWVHCSVGKREWEMHLFRDKETLAISAPLYQYSPSVRMSFEEVTRLPRRVRRYFDAALPQAKTLLILGSN